MKFSSSQQFDEWKYVYMNGCTKINDDSNQPTVEGACHSTNERKNYKNASAWYSRILF